MSLCASMMALDIFALAGLYSAHAHVGSTALDVPAPSWLFTFSMFLCLSHALVKRFSQEHRPRSSSEASVHELAMVMAAT